MLVLPVLNFGRAKQLENAILQYSGPEGDIHHVLDGGATPSHPVASMVSNLSGYLWILLQLCDQEVRKRHRRV